MGEMATDHKKVACGRTGHKQVTKKIDLGARRKRITFGGLRWKKNNVICILLTLLDLKCFFF